jgi:hypothetical protein
MWLSDNRTSLLHNSCNYHGKKSFMVQALGGQSLKVTNKISGQPYKTFWPIIDGMLH